MPNKYQIFTDRNIAALSGVDISPTRIEPMQPILDQVYEFSKILNDIDVGETPTSMAFNPLWEEQTP